VITTSSLPDGTKGSAYGNHTLTKNGWIGDGYLEYLGGPPCRPVSPLNADHGGHLRDADGS